MIFVDLIFWLGFVRKRIFGFRVSLIGFGKGVLVCFSGFDMGLGRQNPHFFG